jgi:hypothetical protein
VKAVSSGFNLNWIELKSAVTTAVEVSPSREMIAYPNPFGDWLRIPGNLDVKQIELVDVLGRSFYMQSNEDKLDATTTAPGFYLLKVTTGSGLRLTQRVTKQ